MNIIEKMLVPAMALLVCAYFRTVSAQCLDNQELSAAYPVDFVQTLRTARSNFTLETLKIIAAFETTGNIFYSPHSLHEALTLAYFSAQGSTENSLKQALSIPSEYRKHDVQRFYASERTSLMMDSRSSSYEFSSANKLWVAREKRIRSCMLDLFSDQLESVDFTRNPEAVRHMVNEWASNETRGHIRDLIPNGGVTEDSDLILANAVYFKGRWQSRFDSENSERGNFYGTDSQIFPVTFMKQKGTFSHVVSEEIGAHILQLPYEGDNMSMYVLLPPFAKNKTPQGRSAESKLDNVDQLIREVTGMGQGSEELRKILKDGMPSKEVEVFLPKFKIDKELSVGQLLSALGAGELLTPAANLTGLLDDSTQNLHLGDAVHRAVVEVNEEGTTASAATAIFSFRSSRPAEPAIFKADHPFLYFIYSRTTRSILFAGVYRTPPSAATPLYA